MAADQKALPGRSYSSLVGAILGAGQNRRAFDAPAQFLRFPLRLLKDIGWNKHVVSPSQNADLQRSAEHSPLRRRDGQICSQPAKHTIAK